MKSKYHGIWSPETSPEIVDETGDILDMWTIIESSYHRLSPEEKAQIETEAAPFGKKVQFTGFDGNNESAYMGVARVMVDGS